MIAASAFPDMLARAMRRIATVALACLTTSCSKGPSWARLPENHVLGDTTVSGDPAAVHRFATAPTVDGRLDDLAWASATTLGPLVGSDRGEPDTSVLAGSWAKIGFDDQALYLGFFVRDTEPFSPAGRRETDPHLWERSSAVEVMLQPGDPGDNRDYYEMQFDANGAVFDTHWDDYNQPISEKPTGTVFGHQDWSCNAQRAATVDSAGYTIELAIPWSAFGPARTAIPPRSGDVWRLNLYAFRDGQRVASAWSSIRRQGNFHRSSRFGRVKFD